MLTRNFIIKTHHNPNHEKAPYNILFPRSNITNMFWTSVSFYPRREAKFIANDTND